LAFFAAAASVLLTRATMTRTVRKKRNILPIFDGDLFYSNVHCSIKLQRTICHHWSNHSIRGIGGGSDYQLNGL
jgi:hypothetical protein